MDRSLASAVLVIATVAQVAAAVFALRLIPLSGVRRSWLLICGALLLQAERRIYANFGGSSSSPFDITVAVAISLLLLLGILDMRSVFTSLHTKELSDALNRIDVISSSDFGLDFGRMMENVLAEAARALSAEKGIAVLPAEGVTRVRYLFGFETDTAHAPEPEARRLEQASRMPLEPLVGEIEQDVERPRFIVAVGLELGEGSRGALGFTFPGTSRRPTGVQLDFVQKLAASLSMTLRNAQLLHEARDVSDTLQSLALALPERIDGVRFGAVYHSASRATRVGGDFYDIFDIPPNRIGLMIGDVSGKGLAAAALTSVAKDTVRAYAKAGQTPAQILTLTNAVLFAVCESTMFVTAFVAVLDPSTGDLTYSNGGHPGPLMKRRDLPATLLGYHEPLLGAFDDIGFGQDRVLMEPGDLLLLYTDGVTEARSAEGLFGDERLLRLVSEYDSPDPATLPEEVLTRLIHWTGRELRDDVAMLAVSLQNQPL